MITLDDLDPEIAVPLRELRDELIANGEEEEAKEMIEEILIGIEAGREHARKREEAEKAEQVRNRNRLS